MIDACTNALRQESHPHARPWSVLLPRLPSSSHCGSTATSMQRPYCFGPHVTTCLASGDRLIALVCPLWWQLAQDVQHPCTGDDLHQCIVDDIEHGVIHHIQVKILSIHGTEGYHDSPEVSTHSRSEHTQQS
eukprot:GHUV01052203.1.p1 GENE.GHUV01052203.1~~GHUV01052203.1.p1  ORF type:complete len:132 (+),score=6.03 GHUV01052203.1:121-516(+)